MTCDFCHAPAHLGACPELIAFTEGMKARMFPDPEGAIIAGIVHDGMPPALEYAKLLAHKLARITRADAYVVNDQGHAMLASPADIGTYWQPEQIVFTAPAAI